MRYRVQGRAWSGPGPGVDDDDDDGNKDDNEALHRPSVSRGRTRRDGRRRLPDVPLSLEVAVGPLRRRCNPGSRVLYQRQVYVSEILFMSAVPRAGPPPLCQASKSRSDPFISHGVLGKRSKRWKE